MPTLADTIHNERVKLRAALLNAAAGSSITLGVLGPIIAAFYGLGSPRPSAYWVLLGVVLWLVAAGVLHWAAMRVLRGLRE